MDLLAKLLAALKQKYSSLGLGDEVLQARAETLIATGLVTEENLEAVAASQKADLENLQRLNDRRVTDALEKQRKKHLEELEKQKAEQEKKYLEELEKLRNPGNKDDATALLAEFKANQEKERKEYEKKIQKLLEDGKKNTSSNEEAFNSLKGQFDALSSNYNELKKELDTEKATKAHAERTAKILDLAKSLGVPQWRIEEGFNIAEDATEEAIKEHLTKVANNVKTNSLPGGGNRFPLKGDELSKEEADELAKSIVK